MAVEWRRQGGRTWIKNPNTGLYDNAFEAIAVKCVKVDALSGEQEIEISIETLQVSILKLEGIYKKIMSKYLKKEE